MPEPNVKYDIKSTLEVHLPSFILLLGNQQISWTKVNRGLEKFNKDQFKDFKAKNIIRREVNFFDLIINLISENKKGLGMIDFFDSILKELHKKLGPEERNYLATTLKNILSNRDSKYINFFGELACLNKFISTGNLKLIQIEKPLGNNKNCDFYFEEINSEKQYYIEILNLHLEDKEFNINELKSFLIQKFQNKFLEKDINDKPFVILQPVLWTKNLKQIEIICELYLGNEFIVDRVNEPFTLSTFIINGKYEHNFEVPKIQIERIY